MNSGELNQYYLIPSFTPRLAGDCATFGLHGDILDAVVCVWP